MLYDLIISPIELIVEYIFKFSISKFENFGVIGAILAVSIGINLLALPLYNIADKLQEKERIATKKLEPRVKRIKKAFKGNEQFMMLNTYYRQNNYSPFYVLRGSLSILLEIPFFIAAYHFLSHCTALNNASFLILKDLGSPDALLSLGSITVNILPIIMTLINVLSGMIYTKGSTAREKIQLYVVALVFLVLLYNSPSGLVVYWIFNNIFSLLKNIVMKTKHPGKILHGAVSAMLIVICIYFIKNSQIILWKKLILLSFSLVITLFPYVFSYVKNNFIKPNHNLDYKIIDNSLIKEKSNKNYFLMVFFSGLALALLTGFLLPASTIATSPSEFSYLGNTDSPLTYIGNSFCFFIGMFILWPLVIYFMVNNKIKKIMGLVLFSFLLICLSNAYIFKSDYGILSNIFSISNIGKISLFSWTYPVSIVSYILIIILSGIIYKKNSRILIYVTLILSLAMLSLGISKIISIQNTFKELTPSESGSASGKIDTYYSLSKDKENVLVIFLDRAIGVLAPQIFNEFPEIKEQFDGFVFYPNTVSFSSATLEGSPPMLGGYEYTVENMNIRLNELMRKKHNEALLVMPVLFENAGFNVNITNPSWVNYHASGDLSIYKDYPQMNVSQIKGRYYDKFAIETGALNIELDEFSKKGFIDFSILQCLPPFLRSIIYNNCRRIPIESEAILFFEQLSDLYYLREMTNFSSDKPTYTFIGNDTTHDIDSMRTILNDDYVTASEKQTSDATFMHYQANVAAYKQLGKYFDYLRDNDVYDNTRIIIVSDHGRGIGFNDLDNRITTYNALLMEKDFNSYGDIKIDESFMTNADTLFLAKKNLPISDINPFTKNKFTQDKNNGVNIFVCYDSNAENFRNKNTINLNKQTAWHVSDNIFNLSNWIPFTEWEKTQEVK